MTISTRQTRATAAAATAARTATDNTLIALVQAALGAKIAHGLGRHDLATEHFRNVVTIVEHLTDTFTAASATSRTNSAT